MFMRSIVAASFAAGIGILGLSAGANAAPVGLQLDPNLDESGPSSCVVRGNGNFSCDITEPNEANVLFQLPGQIGAGTIVLLEQPSSIAGFGIANWSDIIIFSNNNGAGFVTMISDPLTVTTVDLFLDEDPSGVTPFYSGGAPGVNNDYFFHSAADVVPEPATLALFGAGLIGLGALRRRQARKHA